MHKKKFSGDKKDGESLLHSFEVSIKNFFFPYIPNFIETHHLTLLTILWTLCNIFLGFLVTYSLYYLVFVSLIIILQYITDLFDGEVGRRRGTGLIKWGFYMDHFLDYAFLCSLVFIGYQLSPENLKIYYFILLPILTGFMINSFLYFATTGKFRIVFMMIGPTEVRIFFLLINLYIILFGTSHFYYIVPILTTICFIKLLINTHIIQRELWYIDKEKLLKI